MCGIHAAVLVREGVQASRRDADTPSDADTLSAVLRERLRRRGPDHFGQASAELSVEGSSTTGSETKERTLSLRFTSTVLALRGDGLTPQPFVAADGSVFCWNGEAWRLGEEDVDQNKTDEAADSAKNDGAQLFARLAAADSEDHILCVLRAIQGPFAFVFYYAQSGRLFFGRDRLGRRSLLTRRKASQDVDVLLELSSVGGDADEAAPWREVAADGIYVADLGQLAEGDGSGGIARHDWVVDAAVQADGDNGSRLLALGHFNMASEPPAGHRLTADSPVVQALHDQLLASLWLRVLNVPRPPASLETPLKTPLPGPDTRIAVLFSGGLDCTVLARMAHDLLPAGQGIDLVNVAFENPRVAASLAARGATIGGDAAGTSIYEACPDRITGRRSLAELRRVCPGRAWRFVAVDVTYAETLAHRPTVVALMRPHNTEMDLSIASALYFAAGGRGADEEGSPTQITSRVLLSGLGADELFGGYGRHAVAFARQGYGGLAAELRLDVARLGARNLGRDDRVLAHWGREARFPFLDEGLVRWAIGLPAWEKCPFGEGEADKGEGDGAERPEAAKRVLRLVAATLGMTGVAHEKKRAVSGEVWVMG